MFLVVGNFFCFAFLGRTVASRSTATNNASKILIKSVLGLWDNWIFFFVSPFSGNGCTDRKLFFISFGGSRRRRVCSRGNK